MKAKKPPQPVRYSLDTLGNVLREAGTIYRMMRTNKIDHDKGRSLVWVLDKMRSMIEGQHLERMEAQMAAVAAQLAHGQAARGMVMLDYSETDNDASAAQEVTRTH